MNCKSILLLCFFILTAYHSPAQKPFAEGIIKYKVTLETPDHKKFTGAYTFTFKGNLIRKELKLNNGFGDIVLLDCGAGRVHSLQNRGGRKYAIELSMSELQKNEAKYAGYTIKDEKTGDKKIAGYPVYKGSISYADGTSTEVLYSKDWQPAQQLTFERFPGARFLPMYFSYTDEFGMIMQFETEKIEPGPIDNAVFRIPPDYQLITYKEYKELSK